MWIGELFCVTGFRTLTHESGCFFLAVPPSWMRWAEERQNMEKSHNGNSRSLKGYKSPPLTSIVQNSFTWTHGTKGELRKIVIWWVQGGEMGCQTAWWRSRVVILVLPTLCSPLPYKYTHHLLKGVTLKSHAITASSPKSSLHGLCIDLSNV